MLAVCDFWLEDQELEGYTSEKPTAEGRDECVSLCKSSVGCEAVTYTSTGDCLIKAGMPSSTLAASYEGASSMRVCDVLMELPTPALHEAYNIGAKLYNASII